MTDFFKGIPAIKYEGPGSSNEFAFHHYNADEVVMGKRMEDHLRFAVAYWHSFAWPGGDPFGGQTFERPWFGDSMDTRSWPPTSKRSCTNIPMTSKPRPCWAGICG